MVTLTFYVAQEKYMTNMSFGRTAASARVSNRAADNEFGDHDFVMPTRDHLGSVFVEGSSCKHVWVSGPKSPESRKFFQAKFDETEIGDDQKFCTTCDAFSLWEDGKLFAYDAVPSEKESVDQKSILPTSKKNDRKK